MRCLQLSPLPELRIHTLQTRCQSSNDKDQARMAETHKKGQPTRQETATKEGKDRLSE